MALVPLWAPAASPGAAIPGQLAPQASLNRVGCTTVVGIYFWDFAFFFGESVTVEWVLGEDDAHAHHDGLPRDILLFANTM